MPQLSNVPLHTRAQIEAPIASHHAANAETFGELAVAGFESAAALNAAMAEHGVGTGTQSQGYIRF